MYAHARMLKEGGEERDGTLSRQKVRALFSRFCQIAKRVDAAAAV